LAAKEGIVIGFGEAKRVGRVERTFARNVSRNDLAARIFCRRRKLRYGPLFQKVVVEICLE
jgi:hypothetical protein